MNETMQTILTRRSTRKFKVQEIPQTDLDQILKAALYAPSGMGKQTWQRPQERYWAGKIMICISRRF